VEIKLIDRSSKEYADFALRCGTVFNDPDWLALYGPKLALYGIFNGDNMVGTFHVYRQRKGGFSFIMNPPFTPHIGLAVDAKSKNASKAMSETKKIIAAVAEHLDAMGRGGVVSCAVPTWATDMQPLTWKKFKVVPHYTYHTDLTLAQSELEDRMSAEHRNLLKKAVKDGLVCRPETNMQVIKKLVLKTFDRKNTGIDETMLDSILGKFASSKNSFAFAAYDKEVPVAAAFCIHDKDSANYILSGYDPESKHGGAGIICVWNCILHAKQMNLKIFDFEGSMLPEVERYFRGFGPVQVPYYTVNKAWLPLEMVLKFIKREQF